MVWLLFAVIVLHPQILFDKQHTPLFDTGLTLGMRLLYTSVTWSYITNTVAVPCSGEHGTTCLCRTSQQLGSKDTVVAYCGTV